MQRHHVNPTGQAIQDGAIDALADETHLDTDAFRIVEEGHCSRLHSTGRVRDDLPLSSPVIRATRCGRSAAAAEPFDGRCA